jgi:uncharacterized membrane protein YeaQ/YmgE (transglycosylase-associated protein family)
VFSSFTPPTQYRSFNRYQAAARCHLPVGGRPVISVTGIIGGFIGGLILEWLNVNFGGGRRIFTFFVSLLGAVILLWIVGLFRKTKT